MPVTNYYSVNGEIIAEHTAGQSRLDYVTDGLGSVVATVDQTLTVQSTARYKPFGASLTTTGAQMKFGWVGSEGYRGTGLPHSDLYVRKRHSATQEGRWTTADLLWPEERTYVYATSNPITNIDPAGEKPTGAPTGSFPEGCRACSQAILDNWFPTKQHQCNSCYAHCTACCVLTALSGANCAKDMQHLEDVLRPEHNTSYRDKWCNWGVHVASGLSGAGGAGQSCSSQCQSKCPYEYPNPRKNCDQYMKPSGHGNGPNGRPIGIPNFPPGFNPLSQCDPDTWQKCKRG